MNNGRAKKGASFLEGEDPHSGRGEAVGKPESKVERKLKKLIPGVQNLLCQEGSMSSRKTGLEDEKDDGFKTGWATN